MEREPPPRASELEAVPIWREGSGGTKGRWKRSVVDDLTLDEKEKVYLLVQDVATKASANVS